MLSGVVSSFQTGTYTVTRNAAGSYTEGVWSSGSSSTFTIAAVVQPALGKDLEIVPEGIHASDTRKVWTTTALRTADQNQEPDTITIGGEGYRVINVLPWEGLDGDHYECLVAKDSR